MKIEEKTYMILRKNLRNKEKFYWFSAVFMEKIAENATFFEIFWRIFNADKGDNQACFFLHESECFTKKSQKSVEKSVDIT